MTRILRNNRGFALILTILIVSLIVALTLQFNTSTRSALYAAANLRDGITLDHVARSGFNFALAILLEDLSGNDFDTLNEAWARSEEFSFGSASLFEKDRFEIRIKDLSGRIQINALVDEKGEYNSGQKEILTRLLNSEEFGLSPQEVSDLIDAIKDWIDYDDEVTRFGAENAYYQALERPYSCRNGPVELLEGLLLIKGITRDLFYGKDEKPGIAQFLTVYGDGRVNINTADPLLLRALSDQIDQKMAEEMVAYRRNEKRDLSNPKWYQDVSGMRHVTLDPDLVTTSSAYFEVQSKGLRDKMGRQVSGVVERQVGKARIICWKVE